MPAPESELGGHGRYQWADGALESWEQTPELVFPDSIKVYDRMRREDGQVASVLRAITLPIRRTAWRAVGDEVPEEVREATELELRMGSHERGRRQRGRQGVSWREHLRHALLMLPLGFMPFEKVYVSGPPLPGQEGLPDDAVHLRKLGPRMPRTIVRIEVARDGGLDAVVQHVYGDNGRSREQTIPTEGDHLVVYVNDREGADWHGNSILRTAYKNWLAKDVLIRLGPTIVERTGMGVPTVEAPPGGSEAKALELARRVRAGDDAGVGLPAGYRLRLEGVQGSVRDELPLLKYHDQAMGRNALAMFLDLGHDRGARSLGETFLDFFAYSLDAVAEEVGETATEEVVRPWLAHNLGTEVPYPVLHHEPITGSEDFTAEAMASLADAGLLTADDDLEREVRRRYGLPPLPQLPGTRGGPPAGSGEGTQEVVAELEGRLAAARQRLTELRQA